MRKIAVVTGTRAEYGLLKNTMVLIQSDEILSLQLIVTGTHLSREYGYTVDEIKKDGFNIDEEIPILLDATDSSNVAKAMGLLNIGLSQTFSRLKPDFLLILGDRYEILAAAATAMAMNIPIAHISGGEITEGAMDEQIRHAITKLSHLHFPGAKVYGENIIKMGEEPFRVFNVGDPGIENIKKNSFLSAKELEVELGVVIDNRTLLITFHPVTLELMNLKYQVTNLIKALECLDNEMIITYPNSDNGGRYIIQELQNFAKDKSNVKLVESLGVKRYLSVLKLCGAVVGNSSSAIVEAPYLKVPVVNIGNRQKGRLMADNIIQCDYSSESIETSIKLALTDEFREKSLKAESLYGDGDTSFEIVDVLKNINIDEKLLKKKLFWS